jgi:hypothetical protein
MIADHSRTPKSESPQDAICTLRRFAFFSSQIIFR